MRPRDRLLLLVAVVGTALVNGVFSIVIVNTSQNQFTAAQQQALSQARRQGEREVHALCTTFGKLAILKPPPGNPKTNPSRAYLQDQHATLDEIGTDLGCNRHN